MSVPVRLLVAVVAVAVASGCIKRVTEKDKRAAEAHYDLGIEAQRSGDAQGALREFTRSLELDPRFPEAHHAMGLLLHLGFRRPDEAEKAYRRALELRPDFSAAKVNLGNLYLDQGKYDAAIALYDEALNDLRYETPYFALSNKGWAQYKKGNQVEALENIKSAVTTNPKFCLGYRNLGEIYDNQGDTERACVEYGRFREACPEEPDAYFREGVCRAKLGQPEEAKMAFAACESKAKGELKEDCRRLLNQLQ